MIRVVSDAACDIVEDSHFRIDRWTSWACSVVATFPVPIALQIDHYTASEKGVREGMCSPNRLIGDNNFGPVFGSVGNGI
jgi:hypothetical protein